MCSGVARRAETRERHEPHVREGRMIQPAVVSSPAALDEVGRRRHLTRAVWPRRSGRRSSGHDFYLRLGGCSCISSPVLFRSRSGSHRFCRGSRSMPAFSDGHSALPFSGISATASAGRFCSSRRCSSMGVSTTAIGLVPSYASIGMWGAVLLTMLRLLQGVAVGGEWSGSVLMAGEWAAPGKRGLMTSFPQMGSPLGLILANSALATMASVQNEAEFLEWGWRVPFLASLILVGIGLYIRIGILESPVFANIKAQGKIVRARSRW